jgi:pimeloyl-ACP methyl ester carboxylesterase
MLNVSQSSDSGIPVVLIHGGIFSDSFLPLMKVEALRAYRLIRYRRRAYVECPQTKLPITVPHDAADGVRLLDHLGIDAAHFVGHSHGALVAIELARRYSDRVLSLTLLEAGLTAVVPSAALARPKVEPIIQKYAIGQPIEALKDLAAVIFGPLWWNKTIINGMAQAPRTALDARATFESDLVAQGLWNIPEEPVWIRQPVQSILGGESDELFVESLGFSVVSEVAQLLTRAIPSCQHSILPGLNHALHMMDPDLVGIAIERFLASDQSRP